MLRLILSLTAMYGLYAAVMVLLHPTFLYPFVQTPFDHSAYETHVIADDGPTVYVHDAGPDAPVVVYFMGNVGAVQVFLPMLEAHRRTGRSVVAMAYRGGGSVAGTPSERSLKSDALATFDALPDLLSAPPDITVVQGFSLGTGLAVHVAANRDVSGVVLSAGYDRICRLMARASGLLACTVPGVQTWDTIQDAGAVTEPVLMLHGTADDIIPESYGRDLFDGLTGVDPDAQHFVQISGAGHNNLLRFPEYWRAIDAFVQDLSTP